MILSIWRYSHLTLAISSCLLLIVASVTGIVLAFEPVMDKAQRFHTDGFDTLSVAHVVPVLKEQYPGIQEIIIDDNDFVMVKYAAAEGGDQQVYVNAATGKILGTPREKRPLFLWMTTLHRSLFMKETGRIVVGVTSFLLILIAVSGVFLVVQRQNGWKHFFSNIEQSGFAQYYHVFWGRLSLFFILAIALTGTYIAVYRFVPPPQKAMALIDEENIQEEPMISADAFPLFRQTRLAEVEKLQFPFSDFPEDYFFLQLKDKEVCVNQFTGTVLAQTEYTTSYQLASFSLRWHTGRSGSIWAIIMAFTAAYILFFIYSGFTITLKRRRSLVRNRFKARDARVVLLAGSESGSTFKFADAVYKQLVKHGVKVFITDLSKYQPFPQAGHVIVFTSTYGQGDPPSNAKKFAEKLATIPLPQQAAWSIVGFGSRSYTHYCKFAYDVQKLLEQAGAKELLPIFTVNEKSPQDFSDWLTAWTRQTGFQVLMPRELLEAPIGLTNLSVSGKTAVNEEQTFMIRLKARQLKQVVSGDLLAIYPKDDHRERLYSVGKVNNEIQLSIKLHEHGLGSTFLHRLQTGEKIRGRFLKNQHFRFPKKARQIIMISNGTGIAPFLGMIAENKKKIPIDLYCGFRRRSSFALYQAFLDEQMNKERLRKLHLVLSREEEQEYVSHRLLTHKSGVVQALQNGAVIMICGSLSMQNDVLKVLETISREAGAGSCEQLMESERILTDCY
ncbi:PepSY domain-containing protein [Niabella insulamsoli]|uniref:PepSY domain-containing protein n=1 Tax=Niabella insulamsoli TaxID=3144874 RepID=UPI0031FBFF8A